MLAEGVRNVAAGASAIYLERGICRGVKAAVESLDAQSNSVQSRRKKAQLAAMSVQRDTATGELVAHAFEKVSAEGLVAFEKVSAEGLVSLEGSETTDTQLDVVKGLGLRWRMDQRDRKTASQRYRGL